MYTSLQDELWEKVTINLNSAGCGPQKLSKKWAKTWRNWKSNLLKRMATYKSYASGTGGGPPKTLDTSPSEDDLLQLLTPEASGMSNIPEGGALVDNNSLPLYSSMSQNCHEDCFDRQTIQMSLPLQRFADRTSPKKTLHSQRLHKMQLPPAEHSFHNDVINIDNTDENHSINISSNILSSIENTQQQATKEAHSNINNQIAKKA